MRLEAWTNARYHRLTVERRSSLATVENVIRDAVVYCEHARRKTVTGMDVVYGTLQLCSESLVPFLTWLLDSRSSSSPGEDPVWLWWLERHARELVCAEAGLESPPEKPAPNSETPPLWTWSLPTVQSE